METSATDRALNPGEGSVYLWDGPRPYRLFLNKAVKLEHGKHYVVEGIHAQKLIDEIGDPDNGKGGYPLESSCRTVVRMAWPGKALDVTAGQVAVVCARVKRYPARPLFLVTTIEPAEGMVSDAADDQDAPEVSVPADKQQALLLAGKTVHPAPLWAPQGGTAHCKVLVGADGKVSELEGGGQFCESVLWSEFRYQPTLQRNRPVKVKTEVEVRFEPRKRQS